MTTYKPLPKDNYERIAECIRGEQMSAAEVVELFEDNRFLKWYRKKYNLSIHPDLDNIASGKDKTSQKEWLEEYNKGQTRKERCPHN